MTGRKRILFSGSAWVHFACAYPVYRRLAADPRIDFWLTGGFKKGEGDVATYSLEGYYDPFVVDRSRVISVERAREEDFDVVMASHLAPVLPRSFGKSVQIFHGVSFKNLGVREKYLGFDYLCLAGRYHAEAYARHGLLRRPGQCLITGVPKLDALVKGELNRDDPLRHHGLDPRLPLVLYAPTGSKHNSMEIMGKEVLRALGHDRRWNVLVKLHDHPKNVQIDWHQELAPLESDRLRLVRDANVVPYLSAADVLLTDASSVAVEFTLLDRPIVFLDTPELLKDVVERGGALDLETHGRKIGALVERPGQVVGAIEDALAHPQREGERRRAAAKHVFHDPGRATERVTDVVLFAAGLASRLPEGFEVAVPARQEEPPCR